MDKFIIALDEFMINNKICIELNYKIQLDNLSADVISENINRDLGNIINQYSVKEDGLVFLLDISRVNRKDLDVPKVKKNYYIIVRQLSRHATQMRSLQL